MKAVVTAGGTGGHIYPALSIIKKLQEDKMDILYIGSTTRMEKDIIPKEGIPYFGIRVAGFDRKNILNNIKTLYFFNRAVRKTKKKLKEYKPDIVIGTGGYVTAPVIYAAHKLGIKTVIHEQNSTLGMTNKFLSRYVDILFTSFPDTVVDAKKVIYTGNPSSCDKNLKFDKKEFSLSKNKKLVVIVMGSQGSRVVNNKLKEIIPNFKDKDYEVLLITGNDYYDEFKDFKIKNVKIVPFINNLKRVLKSTDILVSRAGATTISEIISYKVPSILIPSPYVTDNHQYKNAKALTDKDMAILLEEDNIDNLINKIDEVIDNKEVLNKIKSNLVTVEINNSDELIYKYIKELLDE